MNPAILDMTGWTNAKQTHRFLGMMYQLSKFSSHLADETISEYGVQHSKSHVRQSRWSYVPHNYWLCTMWHMKPVSRNNITTKACRPVACALSTEQHNAQIEKRYCLWFHIEMDHKPLGPLLTSKQSGWVANSNTEISSLSDESYVLNVPGSRKRPSIADALSRALCH